MNNTAGILIISIGVLFDLIGCIGLIRMPDIYNRLQASTKCVTLGTCMILLGAMVMAATTAAVWKSALCLLFIVITAPTAAHSLARGAYRSGVKLWSKSVADQYAEDQS